MPEATCSVDGCHEPHDARGWCKSHYMRWRRYSNPIGKPPPRQKARAAWMDAHRPDVSAFDDLDDDAFGHWLAGFIDGEGSFVILCRSNGRGSHTPRMQIRLRDDDAPLLDAVQRRLALGSLYAAKVNPSQQKTAKAQALWVVYTRGDCMALVEFLDRYPLLSKKARDYEVWRRAVLMRATLRAHGKLHDWSGMAALKTELEAVRVYAEAA